MGLENAMAGRRNNRPLRAALLALPPAAALATVDGGGVRLLLNLSGYTPFPSDAPLWLIAAVALHLPSVILGALGVILAAIGYRGPGALRATAFFLSVGGAVAAWENVWIPPGAARDPSLHLAAFILGIHTSAILAHAVIAGLMLVPARPESAGTVRQA